jgi:hypothetical protein
MLARYVILVTLTNLASQFRPVGILVL